MCARYRFSIWALLIALHVLLLGATASRAQTTAFTYQGRLTDAGNPANGNFDLQFKLFDHPTVGLGAQQGSTLVQNPITATDGIFSVVLDFGASVFSGANRYLEIGVRPAGNGNPYTVLSARQLITSAPYAIETINAQQLGGLPANRYIATAANGNVGIGTPMPTSKLEIAAQDGLAITGFNPFLTLRDTGTGGLRSLIAGGGGDFGFYTNSTINGFPAMILRNSGNLGLSSPFPAHHLDMNGGPTWTANGWAGAIALSNKSAIGWYPNAAGNSFGIGQTNGGLYFFWSKSAPANAVNEANYYLQISDLGHLLQNRGRGGLVKAMVFVNANGTIARCYNGITGESTGNCGFTSGQGEPGNYFINFGFQIDDRFISVTPQSASVSVTLAGSFVIHDIDSLFVDMNITDVDHLSSFASNPFMVVIY